MIRFDCDEFLFAVNRRGKLQTRVKLSNYKKMKYIGYRQRDTNFLIIESPEKVPFQSFFEDYVRDELGIFLKSRFDIRGQGVDLKYQLRVESVKAMPCLLGYRQNSSKIYLSLSKETIEKLYELKDNFTEKSIYIYDFKSIAKVSKELRNLKRKLLGLPTIGKILFKGFSDEFLHFIILECGSFFPQNKNLAPYLKDIDGEVYIEQHFVEDSCSLYIKPKGTATLIEALEYMGEQVDDYRYIVSE